MYSIIFRRDLIKTFCWIVVRLLIVSAINLPAVYSQVIQTPASEEQRRKAQTEAEERQRLSEEPLVTLRGTEQVLSDSELSLHDEQPCFPLHHLTLSVFPQSSIQTQQLGASALPLDPFYFAQEYLKRYQGRCVGKDGLNLIVRRLGNLILQKGYSTTRVGLAEQDLSDGELTLTLVPGVIHAIRFSDSSVSGTWRNAFPTGVGRVLNLRDLEQGLEQMKRVPSQDIDMQIVPAERPGESDVVLTVTRTKAWKVSASLDNSGAKSTGQLQAGANFSYDNLFGISDLFNIGINTDAERDGSQRGTNGHNLYYAAPEGYWYYSVAASDYDYHQEIAGNGQTYISSGKSHNLDVKTNYLFQRNQTQKNSWQFNVSKRWSHSYVDDTEIDIQKRNVTYVELGWVHKHYVGNVQLDLSLMNRWGTSWFGGQSDASNRQPDYPTFAYTMQIVDATFSIPFQIAGRPLSYSATFRGQTTYSPLYLSDEFSIGGRYTVRGFDGELTLAAERGYYLRNEFTIPFANSGHAAYLGLDVGKVFGPSVKYLVGDKLAGAAIGLRGSFQYFMYDVFASWPISRPDQFATAVPTVGFNLTVQY